MNEALVRVDKSIKQLQLRLDTQNSQDRLQLAQIIYQILDYPDLQEASRHEKANKIGNFDLIEDQVKLANALALGQVSLDKNHICQCCGMIIHRYQIPYCEPLKNINIGLGTMLYFNNIIYNAFALLAVGVLCSIYFLITNIIACHDQSAISCGINGLGLSYKITNPDKNQGSLMTSSILGIVLASIWGLIILFKNRVQKKIAIQIEENFIQASQFTVMIQNFPAKLLKYSMSKNKQIVQKIFKQYEQKIDDGISYDVAKINIAFNLFLQNQRNQQNRQSLQQQLKQRQQPFKQWIKYRKQHNRFSTPAQVRQKMYKQYRDFFITQYDVRRGFEGSSICDENSQQKIILFVTMEQSNSRRQIVKDNPPPSIFNLFNICRTNKFPIQGVKITHAPPPEQIKWTHIGFPLSRKIPRTIGVYLIAILFLGGSLAMTYGLNQVQSNYQRTWVSVAISIIITTVNFLLQFTITILSRFLNQITETRIQFNLAFKICFFEILNAIGVPLVAIYIAKRQLYGQNGLSTDIFFISLFNCGVPLLRFVDPYYIMLNLRNKIYSRPYMRLDYFKSQHQFNKIFDQNEFDLGFQYAYTLKTVIFTSFFLCLQPIIVAFAIVGLLLSFFVNKYRVLYRFQRPRYYSSTVNFLINQILNISPMMFGLGMLIFNNWQSNASYGGTLMLNWVIFIIGGFFFLFPFEILYRLLFKRQRNSIKYQQKIAILPSQYDRLNLVTKQSAISEYRSFLKSLQARHQLPIQSRVRTQTLINQPIVDIRRSIIFGNGDLRNTLRQSIIQENYKKPHIQFRQDKKDGIIQGYDNMQSQQHIIRGNNKRDSQI